MMDVVQLFDHLFPHEHRWQASGGAGECGGVDQGFDVLASLLGSSELIQRAEGDGVELLEHISGQGVGDGVVGAGDVPYV